jgi:hypothetical protein
VLVLNKLLLYHGGKWRIEKGREYDAILTLLQVYQNRDDDAAIALQALQKWGLPSEDTTDFRGRWGVENFTKALTGFSSDQFGNCFFPSMIKPEEQTCHELFEYLTQGIQMPKRTPQPTWEPFQLPKGFYNLTVRQHTLGHLPDVVKDLVSKGRRVQLMLGEYFCIYSDVPLPIGDINQALRGGIEDVRLFPSTTDGIRIFVPQEFNRSLAQCKKLHDVLSNTNLFPVCRAVDYKTVDWSRWDNPSRSAPKAPLGKLKDHIVGKPPKTEIEPAIKPGVRKQAPYPREEW